MTEVRLRWAALPYSAPACWWSSWSMTILSLALPAISADLRPGAVELLWMVDIYALVLAGLLVTASAIGDRWGRRRMLVRGLRDLRPRVAGRAGRRQPGRRDRRPRPAGGGRRDDHAVDALVVCGSCSPTRGSGAALGCWGATAAVGTALGPIIGGALLEAFSWHSAFLVNVPVMAVAIVAALLLLPEAGPSDLERSTRSLPRSRWSAWSRSSTPSSTPASTACTRQGGGRGGGRRRRPGPRPPLPGPAQPGPGDPAVPRARLQRGRHHGAVQQHRLDRRAAAAQPVAAAGARLVTAGVRPRPAPDGRGGRTLLWCSRPRWPTASAPVRCSRAACSWAASASCWSSCSPHRWTYAGVAVSLVLVGAGRGSLALASAADHVGRARGQGGQRRRDRGVELRDRRGAGGRRPRRAWPARSTAPTCRSRISRPPGSTRRPGTSYAPRSAGRSRSPTCWVPAAPAWRRRQPRRSRTR